VCCVSCQINFDLLGELIKFNKNLFQRLNRLLVGEKFDRFVEVCPPKLLLYSFAGPFLQLKACCCHLEFGNVLCAQESFVSSYD
jgi:hypothetical protein